MGLLDSLFKPNIETLRKKKNVYRLIEALEYKRDLSIPQKACDALIEIGKPAGKILANMILYNDYSKRNPYMEKAVIEIAKSSKSVIELLSYGLNKSDKQLVLKEIFLKIGEKAIEVLILYMRQYIEDRDVNNFLSELLIEIGKPAVPYLLIHLERNKTSLKDYDRGLRRYIPYILGEIGDERAIEPLMQHLSSYDVAHPLIRIIEKIGEKDKLIQPFVEILEAFLDRQWQISDKYIPSNSMLHEEGRWETVYQCILIVGILKRKECIDLLIRFICDYEWPGTDITDGNMGVYVNFSRSKVALEGLIEMGRSALEESHIKLLKKIVNRSTDSKKEKEVIEKVRALIDSCEKPY